MADVVQELGLQFEGTLGVEDDTAGEAGAALAEFLLDLSIGTCLVNRKCVIEERDR